MKQILSERGKHRLIGVLVIVSIVAIFMPAVMKQSNQRFEENLTVSLKLPAKPVLPEVSIPNSKTVFKSVKVATVSIPAAPSVPTNALIAAAKPLDDKAKIVQKSILASVATHSFSAPALAPKPLQTAKQTVALPIKKEAIPAGPLFSVQVATFVQKSNADHLVNQFKRQGFQAAYYKVRQGKTDVYKVIVGQLREREKAQDLQKKIATNMQLNGFIVKVG